MNTTELSIQWFIWFLYHTVIVDIKIKAQQSAIFFEASESNLESGALYRFYLLWTATPNVNPLQVSPLQASPQ